jgi:hypothetical protein
VFLYRRLPRWRSAWRKAVVTTLSMGSMRCIRVPLSLLLRYDSRARVTGRRLPS